MKKTSHLRLVQLCYPKNVQIIWDNLFVENPDKSAIAFNQKKVKTQLVFLASPKVL
ncbi:hypothetical protein H6H01_08650 [Nostoc calcicola FACHB-3891]|nr:hypothetical protein [Nostoc calcicola FACHB-3891]